MRQLWFALLALILSTRSYAATPCEGGQAGPYPCDGIDLLSHVLLSELGGGEANDCWGWIDPGTRREYAIVGLTNGTSFVDISDPEAPEVKAFLPSHTGSSPWRDIKTYADHAFIVSDGNGPHGLQIYDLTELRALAGPPQTVTATAHYSGFGPAHNIVINESSGFAYVVGSNLVNGGPVAINLANPTQPTGVGGFGSDGYTSDAQCVDYRGPDSDYAGREVCVCFNQDTITLVDVTDKTNMTMISRSTYPDQEYVSQGWLTRDQRYLLQSDQSDEATNGHDTRTHIWDLSDLDSPIYLGFHEGDAPAIDQNQYVWEGHVYQANFHAGLRVLELTDLATATLNEVAFFDIYPDDDDVGFDAAWSVYPFLPSGNLIVSGVEQGLFVLRSPFETASAPLEASIEPPYARPNPFRKATRVGFVLDRLGTVEASVWNPQGQRITTLHRGVLEAGAHELTWEGRDHRGREVAPGVYFVQVEAGDRGSMVKVLKRD